MNIHNNGAELLDFEGVRLNVSWLPGRGRSPDHLPESQVFMLKFTGRTVGFGLARLDAAFVARFVMTSAGSRACMLERLRPNSCGELSQSRWQQSKREL